MSIKKKTFSLLIFVLLLLTFSCRMEQTLVLDSSEGGQYEFSSENAPFFEQTLEDAALFSGYSGSGDFLKNELRKADKNFTENPEVTESSLIQTEVGINGSVKINNLEKFFAFYQNSSFTQKLYHNEIVDNQRIVTFNFSRDSFNTLLPLIPLLENPAFSAFTPMGTEGLTQESYLDDLSFSFGEESLSLFTSRSFILTIKTEQNIEKYEYSDSINAEKQNDKTLMFSLPLIRLMLMDEKLNIKLYLTQ